MRLSRNFLIGVLVITSLAGCGSNPIQNITQQFYEPCSGSYYITGLHWLGSSSHIAYHTEVGVTIPILHIADLSDQTSKIMDNLSLGEGLVWSSDGTHVLVIRPSDPHVIDLATDNRQSLPIPGLLEQYAISWDGSKVAALTKNGESFSIVLLNSDDGSTIREIPDMKLVNYFTWSPDSEQLAMFIQHIPSGEHATYDLVIFNIEDGTMQTLITEIVPQMQIVWSPDGTRLAFVNEGAIYGDAGAAEELHLINVDGTHHIQLRENRVTLQQWTDDSTRLIYIAGSLIVSTGSNGGGRTVLGSLLGSLGVVSPDGQWYAYVDKPAQYGADELMITALDGSQTMQLTQNPGNQLCLTWPF